MDKDGEHETCFSLASILYYNLPKQLTNKLGAHMGRKQTRTWVNLSRFKNLNQPTYQMLDPTLTNSHMYYSYRYLCIIPTYSGRLCQSDMIMMRLMQNNTHQFYWRYVALVVVLWCPAWSSSASVTALRREPVNVHCTCLIFGVSIGLDPG